MKKIEWILRVALFGEFLGHGIFAYRAVPDFQRLLAGATGFPPETAATILPFIGMIDFVIAALALLRPIRIALLYASIWGFLTALARPLSGKQIWTFVERWPNCGVPLALLFVRGWPKQRKDWFK